MLTKHIGVDLGTVNVLVWVRGKGIILQEPSVVAIAINDNKIVAVGSEARAMLGRTPETIEVARPLRDGVIADYVVTEAMLRYFIEKVAGRLRLFKPLIAISVPVGVTSVESRAVHDAAIQAGGREAYLIPEPLAAAIGAGMPVNTPTGNLVVDIGGGTSEAAVISMNGIVEFASVRIGGNRIDEAIISYVKRKYNLMIGEQTAEDVKIKIGGALPLAEELTMEVRGRDQVSGLPKTIQITSGEVTEAIAEPLASIVGVVKNVLEKTPPELASDVIDRGIVMTGGGSLLRDFHQLLTKETGVPCYVADNPIACVALGAGKALEDYEVIKRSLPAY
ncbi:MAG: rod shape-determining protein [Anaerolineae bacterium]|nr:rod shape-determining protein [Anaerolineae bacterium]